MTTHLRTPPLALATCLLTAAAALAVPPPPKASRASLRALVVYPAAIDLTGPRAEQRLGVLGTYADGTQRDLSRTATFTSRAPGVAAVDRAGILRPVGDGATVVSV